MKELEAKVIEIVHEAAKIIDSSSHSIAADKGSKENFATEADIRVQSFLKERLTALIPGSSFLGEEGNFTKGDYTWIVDPIDGTVNFFRDIQFYVISVALVRGDDVLIGVIYNPKVDETYHAVAGNGSYLNGKAIHVSDRDIGHSVVCLAWSVYEKKWADICFDISKELFHSCEDIRRLGSAAYELCLIARGSVELLFEMRLFPWDYAAGSLILKEAGGTISSVDGPIDYYDQCTVLGANSDANMDTLKKVVRDNMGTFRISGSIWG